MIIKELTPLDLLKLSLEYSISKKHQRSLIERINKLEGKSIMAEKKPSKRVKNKVKQECFL